VFLTRKTPSRRQKYVLNQYVEQFDRAGQQGGLQGAETGRRGIGSGIRHHRLGRVLLAR
jgi:hypothetical protein